jgi:hypothetical protein
MTSAGESPGLISTEVPFPAALMIEEGLQVVELVAGSSRVTMSDLFHDGEAGGRRGRDRTSRANLT